jgi:prephenate dehydrogenase
MSDVPPLPSPPAADSRPAFSTIGIIGLGLIGGSIALAVRELWPLARVVGVDNAGVLTAARQLQAIDDGAEDLDVLKGVDLLVLAAPVRQNIRLLSRLADHVPDRTIVTDTGSTKRDIALAAASLPGHLRFVGGHPLGGAAVGGFEHARPDLFRDRHWIFTPSADTSTDTIERLQTFAAALGAIPHVMSVDEHDRVLAFLSHLPQLAASALMAVVGEAVGAGGLALAGRGLADTTRLASSPSDIWRDIAASNADQIAPALDRLIVALQSLRSDLEEGRALDEIFADAARWREQLTARSTL